MVSRIVWVSALLLFSCRGIKIDTNSKPIAHEAWTALLQKYVTDDGWVDYDGFKSDSVALQSYLDLLRKHHPNDQYWSEDEQLAYWINAYNAFTIEIVSENYPVASIKDIKNGIPFVNTVWDIKFIHLQGASYDLNNIEHGIIRRKFDEPRIHFAVNCASESCPKLLNKAYEASTLEVQLAEAARSFINDPSRNNLADAELKLSKIFSWFKGDFTKSQSLLAFLNTYSNKVLSTSAKISHLDYSWKINDLRAEG